MNKQLALLLTTLMICPAIIGMDQSRHRRSLSESSSPKFSCRKNALLLQPYKPLETMQGITPLVQNAQQYCPKALQQMNADALINDHANIKKEYWWGPEEWKKNIVISNDTKVLGLMLYTLIHKKLCCIETGYVVQLDLIAIDPTEQRQGNGSKLLWALEKKARMHSVDLITTCYPTTNSVAQAFFKNNKFKEIQNNGTLITVQKKLTN